MWGWSGIRAALTRVGIWEGDFQGEEISRETSEGSTLRWACAGMAFLSSFEKQILFLALFVEATILDRSHPSCPHAPKQGQILLCSLISSLLQLCHSPRWCLTGQKGQSCTVPLPTPCSPSALLTIWIWCSGPQLNIYLDHCLSWLLTLIWRLFHDLDCISSTLSL